MTVKHLDHLNMSVRDFAETADWYGRIFGFAIVETGTWNGRPWGVLRSGEAMLCVYEHPQLEPADRASRRTLGINHFGLRITDKKAWEDTIERESVSVLYGGPVRWPHSTAWYVADPNGYEIEVAAWDGDRVAFNG